MARWGRRGLFHVFGRNRPFRRTRTVQWGSRSSSGGSSSAWGGKWQPRKPAIKLSSRGRSGFIPGIRPAAAPKPKRSGMRLRSRGAAGGWGTRTVSPKKRRGTIVAIAFAVAVLLSIQAFVYVDRHLREPMMNVAKVRINQLATQAINEAITEQVATKASFDKLIDWKMSGDGKISGFMLNYAEHMKITAETVQTVSSTLFNLSHLKESVPIGHALGSAILSSYGPRVPVNFEPVGAAKVELNTRQSSIGINNTLVEVYIKVRTEVSIVIPFDSEPQLIEAEIPVSYLLVVGDVPMYYYDNKGNPVGGSAAEAPNISLPVNPDGSKPPAAPQEGAEGGSGTGGDAGEASPAPPAGDEANPPGGAAGGLIPAPSGSPQEKGP